MEVVLWSWVVPWVLEVAEVGVLLVVLLVEVVLLRVVVHLPAASCRRSRCGVSVEAPLPVSVESRVLNTFG